MKEYLNQGSLWQMDGIAAECGFVNGHLKRIGWLTPSNVLPMCTVTEHGAVECSLPCVQPLGTQLRIALPNLNEVDFGSWEGTEKS